MDSTAGQRNSADSCQGVSLSFPSNSDEVWPQSISCRQGVRAERHWLYRKVHRTAEGPWRQMMLLHLHPSGWVWSLCHLLIVFFSLVGLDRKAWASLLPLLPDVSCGFL